MKIFGLIDLCKRLMRAKTTNKGEVVMAKTDVVSAGVSNIQSGEVSLYQQELGKAYDGGFSDGVASVPPVQTTPGTFTQADIDAAVAADKAQLQPQIDSLTAQVSALQADDDAKTKIIAGIQALLAPPAPAPAPAA